VWGVRLASFLLYRIMVVGHDWRLNKYKKSIKYADVRRFALWS
jgi:hypothetical protein